MDDIRITGANEGNLKNVSLNIPKNKLVVFTGLSGSGKSTLLIDVLFNECQRQYLEAMSMQGIRKPKVERIRGVSPAILITQRDANKNPRSTVGTQTDVYTDLRMVYEKLGLRQCPFCGETISAADCKEETEKINNDFNVYMYCCKCGRRMDKITRSHFSFNTMEGACPVCEGLGRIHSIRKQYVLNEGLSLEDGAVTYWDKQYGKYQISVYYAACRHYGIPVPHNIPVSRYGEAQKTLLCDGFECAYMKEHYPDTKPPRNTADGKFEGIFPNLWRRLSDKDGNARQLENCFDIVECPECKGERLGAPGRNVTVNKTRLPQLSLTSLKELFEWVKCLEDSLPKQHILLADSYLLDIKTKLTRYINVGLGYLSLDRQIITLSGGELQRLRLAAVLDSDLSGVIYMLDEPTVGLHPKDTAGLVGILQKLRDLGNSVYIIEHDADVMACADYIVDIGPGSGKFGGEVTAAGTLSEIKRSKSSVTGRALNAPLPSKTEFRKPSGWIHIGNACLHNLKKIDVDLPAGCLTAVTGPSGSGKSTLIFEVLAKAGGFGGEQGLGCESGLHAACDCNADSGCNTVSGLEPFDQLIEISQSAVTKMKRSNVATYSGVYSEIRTIFAKTKDARAAGLKARHFSFNTPGGRCENCGGLGYVDNNMLFFANTEVVCPVCNGSRFHEKVLSVKYKGLSIQDVLALSVEDAAVFFADQPKILRILRILEDVGLGYPELGQTLTTLSGGEGQRLKLARELTAGRSANPKLFLLDEPTTGLHPVDIEHFLVLLNRLTDAGNTVVVVEHNQQLILNCDWVVDLGPEGGEKGGRVQFTGTPAQLAGAADSVTAQYLPDRRGCNGPEG